MMVHPEATIGNSDSLRVPNFFGDIAVKKDCKRRDRYESCRLVGYDFS